MVDRILRNNVDIVDAATSGADEIATNLELEAAINMISENGWKVVRTTHEDAGFFRDDVDIQICLWVEK